MHGLLYLCLTGCVLRTDMLSIHKAAKLGESGWDTSHLTERTCQAQEAARQAQSDLKQRQQEIERNLRHELAATKQHVSDLERSRTNWKQRALCSEQNHKLAQRGLSRFEAAVKRLRQLNDTKRSRMRVPTNKRHKLQSDGRWDLRKSKISLLSQEERKKIVVHDIMKNIRDGGHGNYTGLTKNYGPKILQDYHLTANTMRPMLKDIFSWWVSEDVADVFDGGPHRTTISRYAVAKTAVLKATVQSFIDSQYVTSICMMIDASKRKKKDHMPSGATYSRKGARGRIVDAKLLSDSVTAGKTGFSEATHLWNQLSPEARLKMDAILFDTTSSNTGKLHGLAAELERLAARDLMVIRCLLHVLSLLMVSFGTRLCGETPSLHTGSSTEPQAIALLLFLHYCENREWKDLKEAYFTLWKPHTSYVAEQG